jgi:acetoacetate decarboxylase
MGHAELDRRQRYVMPPAFGPSVAPDVEDGFDLHGSSVEYDTAPEALAPLLPKWFRPTAKPVVSFGYRQMINMSWMGGRNYQILRVGVSVEHEKNGAVTANNFGLVLWESDCAPILAGRELMGAPKLFGTIPPITVGVKEHSFECHEYDARLIRGSCFALQALSESEVAAKRSQQADSWVYYWKYIPGVGDEPDADYPVAIKLTTPFVRMWQGQGALELGTPSAVEAPYSHHIVRRLAELPRLSAVRASAWHATGCTLRRDLTRRLDR